MAIYDFEHFADRRVADIPSIIRAFDGTPVAELRVFALAVRSGRPRLIGRGVYCFSTAERDVLYVGKTTSRRFIERIPAHFDSQGWFGTFWKRMAEHYASDSAEDIVKRLASTNFIGIEFSSDADAKAQARRLETLLHGLLEPPFVRVSRSARLFASRVREMRIRDALQIAV